MKIILTLNNGNIYFLDYFPDQSILDLKKLIAITSNIPVQLQTLEFNEIILDNQLKLSSYDILEDHHIKLIIKSNVLFK